jgi:hypothetical protein
MRISRTLAALATVTLTCATAQATEITGNELKKAMQENPDVLIEAIKANRKAIFDIIIQTWIEEHARQCRAHGFPKRPICQMNLRAGPGEGRSKGLLFKGDEEFSQQSLTARRRVHYDVTG